MTARISTALAAAVNQVVVAGALRRVTEPAEVVNETKEASAAAQKLSVAVMASMNAALEGKGPTEQVKAGKKAKAVKAAVVKAPKVKSTVSKQAKAVGIFQREKGDRAKTVAAIQTELTMSLAGATTYFYNAKRISAKATSTK